MTGSAGAGRTGWSWRRAVRIGFLLVALGFGGWAVAGQWDAVRDGFARLSWPVAAGSLAAVLLALTAGMLTWRALLADLGSPLPVRTGARLFFLTQIGKYIPGAVWPVLAQMEMGRDLGIPRSRSAAAFFLTLPVQLGSGLTVAVAILPAVAPGSVTRYAWALVLIPVLAVALQPRVVNAVLGLGLRLLKRAPLERPLTRRGLAAALGWALAGWLAYGVHLAFLVLTLGAETGLRVAVFSVGAFALSWCLGIMTFVVPAGAGVREVAMVAVLSPVLPQGPAIAVALCSRLLLIAGDLVWAALAGLAARRGGGAPPVSPVPPAASEGNVSSRG